MIGLFNGHFDYLLYAQTINCKKIYVLGFPCLTYCYSVRGKLGSVKAPFASNTRCYWRRAPVTPGVTGANRRLALGITFRQTVIHGVTGERRL